MSRCVILQIFLIVIISFLPFLPHLRGKWNIIYFSFPSLKLENTDFFFFALPFLRKKELENTTPVLISPNINGTFWFLFS